jgi:hypothetical protein
MRSSASWVISALSLIPASCGIAFAQPVTQPLPALTVVARDGVEPTGPASGRYDFGEADPLKTPLLTRVFTLRNDTTSPVTIDRFQSSCGCATSLLLASKSGKATVPPGKEVAVKVTLDLVGQPPILLDKAVWALPSTGNEPVAMLQVVARIRPLIRFQPASIDLGNMPVSRGGHASLTVEIDLRIMVASGELALICKNPDILIRQTTLDERRTDANGFQLISRTYSIQVPPNARLGALMGRLQPVISSPSPKAAKPANQASFAAAQRVLRPIVVTVQGYVNGSVSARPGLVFFGGIPVGQGAIQTVVLEGKTTHALDRLQVTSSSRWVSVRMRAATEADAMRMPSSSNSHGASYSVLEVSLDPKAPASTYQTEINVRTAVGERLVIPVTAYVMSVTGGTNGPLPALPTRTPPRRLPSDPNGRR